MPTPQESLIGVSTVGHLPNREGLILATMVTKSSDNDGAAVRSVPARGLENEDEAIGEGNNDLVDSQDFTYNIDGHSNNNYFTADESDDDGYSDEEGHCTLQDHQGRGDDV